jgi:peptidyl-prolyl cis-trans isomerase C
MGLARETLLHSLQARFTPCAAALLVVWSAWSARAEPSEVRTRDERQPQAQLAQAASTAQPRTAQTQTQTASVDSPALATFEGGRITVADVQAAAANKDLGTRRRIAEPGGREALVEQLVRFDLLVLEAERRGYGYHPAVIEAGKRAAIEHMLERDLAVEPSSISAADVKDYFAANAAKYQRPEMRRATHIEVASADEARALIAELKGAARERFAKVAGERSRDERTRRQGGELGYFDREGRLGAAGAPGAVPAELAEAAFALGRSGAISQRPIQHARGFSVLMLTGEMPALDKKLADVEAEIRAELSAQRMREAQEALVVRLREQWKPELHPERMDAIELEPAKPLGLPQGFPAAPPDPRAPARIVEPDGI